MFEREIEKELAKWAEDKYRKPLVLRGARQVGKTTVVDRFSAKFDNYLKVNLEKTTALQIFESTDDVNKLLEMLFLYCDIVKKEGRTLVFIDEIQNSSQAVAMLRYFYEETPEIFVIAAGSLLETMLDKHITLPVGRIEYLALHPCSFTEYLNAIGEGRFVELIQSAEVPEAFHKELLQNFNSYALIGGMPEVISRYANERNVPALSKIYNNLLVAYRNDVEKYAKTQNQVAVIRYILNEGWAFAGQRIIFGGFAASNFKARETTEAFRTLEKAMLLDIVYPMINNVLPIVSDLKKSPKLFWLDAGLVNYSAKIQREFLFTNDLLSTWKGMAAEQIVYQELKTLSFEVENELNFWVRDKRGSTAEVDFIYIHNGRIIPIEVKSGHNAHLKSIHQFIETTNHNTAIRVWSKNFSVDDVKTNSGKSFKLINLPFYLLSAIPYLLEKY